MTTARAFREGSFDAGHGCGNWRAQFGALQADIGRGVDSQFDAATADFQQANRNPKSRQNDFFIQAAREYEHGKILSHERQGREPIEALYQS